MTVGTLIRGVVTALALVTLAACGTGPPNGNESPEPGPVVYDGSRSVENQTGDDGRAVVLSQSRNAQVDIVVTDDTDKPLPGIGVAYDEIGDTAVVQVRDPASGRMAVKLADLTGVQASSGALETESITAVIVVAVTLKAVIGVTLWRQAHAISEEIAMEIQQIPNASVDDDVTEMCLTPEEYVFLTQAFAAMREREIGAYRAFGEGILAAVPGTLPDGVTDALHVVGLVSDLGHVGDILSAPAAEDIREFALEGLQRSDLGVNDTLEVTFLGFRSYPTFGDGYAWSVALITGADCDPATFTDSIGQVAFTSDMTDVEPRGYAPVTVQVTPPESGLDVYLTQTGREGSFSEEWRRRFPPVSTDAGGYATFWLPVNTNGIRTLTATVPERRVAAQSEISWRTDWFVDTSTFGPQLFDVEAEGFQALVGERVVLSYRPELRDFLDRCDVDWREGNGWEEFDCPTPQMPGAETFFANPSLVHRYETTGIFRPTIRLTDQEGRSTEAFGIVSVVEETPNVAPAIQNASIDGGFLTYSFDDDNDFDRHKCSLWDRNVPLSDPVNGYLLWSDFVCPRSDTVLVPVGTANAEVFFRVTDGAESDEVSIAVQAANTPPELTAFAATPDRVDAMEPVAFSWTVDDSDGDVLTCRLDIDGEDDIEFDYVRTGNDCRGSHEIEHAYEGAGVYEATLRVEDGRGQIANASASLTVVETVIEHALTIRLEGLGSGRVMSDPLGIDCGSACSAEFPDGEPVSLSVDPDAGSVFAGWSGPSDCNDGRVTLTESLTCTASFEVARAGPNLNLRNSSLSPIAPVAGDDVEFCVTWENSGDTVIPYVSGEAVGVAAMYLDDDRLSSARFSNEVFYGDIEPGMSREACANPFADVGGTATTGTHTIYVYADVDDEVAESSESDNYLEFAFDVSQPEHTLIIDVNGAGTVSSSPTGIICGSDCDESYPYGTSVSLAATPSNGWQFDGWTGDADCSNGSVTMTAPRSCIANFSEQAVPEYLLSIDVIGSGSVTSSPAGIACGSDCEEAFPEGTSVTLTPQAATGWDFSSWSGDADCSGGSVTMTGPRSCSATFELEPSPAPVIEDVTGPSDGGSDDVFSWAARIRDPDSTRSDLSVSVTVYEDGAGSRRVGEYPLEPTTTGGDLAEGIFYDASVRFTVAASTRLYWRLIVSDGTNGDRYPTEGYESFAVTFDDPAPIAALQVSPITGEAPLDVTLDACGSTDNGAIETYAFDTGDGGGFSTTSCTWTYRYQNAGTFTPTVTVYDSLDQTDTAAGKDVTVAPPADTQPNLVLENAYLVPANPLEGDNVEFCVTWRNAGDATAVLPADGNIVVSRAFLDDDGASGARFSNSLWYADIPVGGSREECVDVFLGDPATPGSHTVYAYTDADLEIEEANENDNRLVVAFDVDAAPTNAAPRITDLWAEQQGDVYACGSMIPDNDTTTFRWTASDADGDTLAYDWRMDGEPWTRQTATYESEMISDYGDHTFDVRAVDPSGATSQVRSCTVNASDPPEIFGFDGPGINETATVGSPATFVMDVRDPDDHYPSEAVLYLYDPYQRIEMTQYLDGGADTRLTYVASVTFSASGPRRYSMVVIDALGVAGDSTGFIDFTVYP